MINGGVLENTARQTAVQNATKNTTLVYSNKELLDDKRYIRDAEEEDSEEV